MTITLVGDLLHGRTVHSLAKLVAYYDAADVRLCLVSRLRACRMPADITSTWSSRTASKSCETDRSAWM